MSEEIKYMDIKEFRELGYLQEVNRQFLHPLGLALEVKINDEGEESLGGIWDYRDDPEGMMFGAGTINKDKAYYVKKQLGLKRLKREALFEDIIQPINY